MNQNNNSIREEFRKLQEQMHRLYAAIEGLSTGQSDGEESMRSAIIGFRLRDADGKKITWPRRIESLLREAGKPHSTREILAKLSEETGQPVKSIRNTANTNINMMKKAGKLVLIENPEGKNKRGKYALPDWSEENNA